MNLDMGQQLILFGIVAAVFGLAIPLYLIIRSKGGRRTKTSISGSDADVLDCLKTDYPAAFDVLACFAEVGKLAHLSKLDPSANAALADVRDYAQREIIPENNSSSVLQLSKAQDSSANNQLQAALVTLFRVAYSDPKAADLLGLKGRKALDTFLDSLTE